MADPANVSDAFPPAAEAGPPPVLAAATADHADREQREFTPLERFAVWNKAREAHPLNCAYWRLDESGNLMAWGDFGDAQSPHGWLIDHMVPLNAGGTNALDNLVAIHVVEKPFFGGFFDGSTVGETAL